MININLMLEFSKNFRNNEFFLTQALNDIKLGYYITEYLNPDSESKFEPDKTIKNDLLSINGTTQLNAVDRIAQENDIEISSYKHVQETLNYLVPIYMENSATAKDKKRIELLRELKKLDEEE